jgi:alpha-1,2-mannosyltransferase
VYDDAVEAGVAELTARERVLIALSILYAAAVIPIAIHKGIDFEIHLKAAQGLLAGQSLFSGPATIGVWWPPFAILALTPFALIAQLSLPLAKAAFALLGVACVAWSVARFMRAGRQYLALAVGAVAVPLQINFDYLNINAVLLALVVAGGFDLRRGRDVRAGVWLGLATALKVFPALLLLYAAYRRRWRAAASGAGITLGLTVCSLLPLGVPGALASARDWLTHSSAGVWVLHRRNQSLPALLSRAGMPHPGAIAIDLLLLILAAVALWRSTDDDIVHDIGIVALLAVLLSPIAWDHYFLLAFPAWVAALSRAPASRPRAARIALIAAGIATSGVLTVGSSTVRGILLEHSIFGWGALVLVLILLVERLRGPVALPQLAPIHGHEQGEAGG